MMEISLADNAFFRDFGEISYLFNQSSLSEAVIDDVAGKFISKISRSPRKVLEIVNDIQTSFRGVDSETIKSDFLELINVLNKDSYFEFHGTPLSIATETSADNTKQDNLDTGYVLKKHFQKSPAPFFAQIELTSACNLKCIHCYWTHHNLVHLKTEDVFRILDELHSMKCLHLSLSGGESLLHPDILTIIQYARTLDFSVTLMTNAVNLDLSSISILSDTKLCAIQVSLYSLDETIHDSITGISGSHAKTIKAIDQLLRLNVPTKIACPVMKQNYSSFIDVTRHFMPLGVFVDHDLEIVAKADFTRGNLEYRLSKDELQMATSKINRISPSPNIKARDLRGEKKTIDLDIPVCGAGIQMLSVSCQGDVFPCPTFNYKLGNVFDSDLKTIWNSSKEISDIRSLKFSDYKKCHSCKWIDSCSLCPAKFHSESEGDYKTPQPFFCRVAEANYLATNSLN